MMKILIISAHPDDEVLGMGATIKKLSSSNNIHLCVVSEGATAQYKNPKMIQVRKDACKKSAKVLGISKITFLDLPDMQLDSIPQLKINQLLEEIIEKTKPVKIYTTPNTDLNKDHQIVFDSTLIAARPSSSTVKEIYSYELPGFTREPFSPNVFVDISKFLDFKINAFKLYKSEVKKFPHPRSIVSIKNLAKIRGVESGLHLAESFKLIRSIS
jgi:LmbE family N-acetylglucosaminyl deacetylase